MKGKLQTLLGYEPKEPHLNPPPRGGLSDLDSGSATRSDSSSSFDSNSNSNSDSNSDCGSNASSNAASNSNSSPASFPTGEGRDGVPKGDSLYRLTSTPQQWAHLKDFARSNRKEQTPAEKIVWELVRAKKLSTRFRRQHAIGYFIVDFVCLEFQLVVEIDGESHDLKKEYDEWRTLVLNQLGYRVIRFTNDEVLGSGEFVEKEIWKWLVKDEGLGAFPSKAEPLLNPPPKGRTF